ncbi:MAG: alpha-L-fucosidase [Bacteroidaceae bacterium]|nr:alpha-L-fucosidase [Bacteroidaceae bacterium]
MNRKLFLLLFSLCLALPGVAQPGYLPTDANLAARAEFNDSRFGVFIHWGIYSMMGDGEWVMQNQNLPYAEYSRLAAGFYPSKFNAAQWVSAIKASGAKYITITSRHHDGFSMFGTKASPYNIVDATPFKRDIIAELSAECQKQGIKLHFYYSHLDWGREDYYPLGRTGWGTGRKIAEGGRKERPAAQLERSYLDFMNTQLTELLTKYGPIGAIWFDGVWDQDAYPREAQPNIWNLYEQYSLIHRLQPACLIGNNHHLLPFEGEDMQIFEQDIPGQNDAGLSGQEISRLPLETCKTMNNSWGFNIRDTGYKSPSFLIQYLVRTAGKGANLLLNVGPRPDGTIPEEALERLAAIGKWLEKNGKTIYGTQGGCIEAQEWGVTTQRGKTLYVHLLPTADNALPRNIQLAIPKSANRLKSANFFGTKQKVSFKQTKEGVSITLPELDAAAPDIILELSFAKEL